MNNYIKKILLSSLLVISLSLSGCFTLMASTTDRPLEPMAGTRFWLACTRDPMGITLAIYGILDLPISFALDVALLPITIPVTLFREYFSDDDEDGGGQK